MSWHLRNKGQRLERRKRDRIPGTAVSPVPSEALSPVGESIFLDVLSGQQQQQQHSFPCLPECFRQDWILAHHITCLLWVPNSNLMAGAAGPVPSSYLWGLYMWVWFASVKSFHFEYIFAYLKSLFFFKLEICNNLTLVICNSSLFLYMLVCCLKIFNF